MNCMRAWEGGGFRPQTASMIGALEQPPVLSASFKTVSTNIAHEFYFCCCVVARSNAHLFLLSFMFYYINAKYILKKKKKELTTESLQRILSPD